MNPAALQLAMLSIPVMGPDQVGTLPPTEFRLFPKGKHTSEKGDFIFDETSAKSVLKRAKEKGNDIPIDYEHFMLETGEKLPPGSAGGVPAAGWFNLEVRNGELWAVNVRWTDKASAYLKQKEYRYVSPAFTHTKDGTIMELVNCALVNLPAQHKQTPLVAAKDDEHTQHETKEPTVMEHLLAALKLSKSAAEPEAVAVVTSLQTERAKLLEATGKKDLESALGVIAALKENTAKLERANQELLKVKAEERARRVHRLVAQGIKAKKIPPAMKEHFTDVGMQKNGLKFLKAHLESATPLVSTKKLKAKKDDRGEQRAEEIAHDEATLKVVAQKMGISVKELKKQVGKGIGA